MASEGHRYLTRADIILAKALAIGKAKGLPVKASGLDRASRNSNTSKVLSTCKTISPFCEKHSSPKNDFNSHQKKEVENNCQHKQMFSQDRDQVQQVTNNVVRELNQEEEMLQICVSSSGLHAKPGKTEGVIFSPKVTANKLQQAEIVSQMIADEGRQASDVIAKCETESKLSPCMNDKHRSLVDYDMTSDEELDHSKSKSSNPTPTYDLRKQMATDKQRHIFDFASSSDEIDDCDEYMPSSGTDDEDDSTDTDYDEKNSLNKTVYDEISEPDEPHDPNKSSKIQIMQTKNIGNRRMYDKKQYCIYCDKPFSKITKHWLCSHSKESEVIEISLEKDKKKKLSLITLLRNKGNHIHNCCILKEGKGELVVTYRPNSNKSLSDYRPCEHCLGYYSSKELYRHRCKIGPVKYRGRVATKALMLLPAPDSARTEVMTILNGMLDGPVKIAIRSDNLLLKLASKLYLRHGNEKKDLVRARLREIGRLMVEMQKENGLKTLQDCLKPHRFKSVINAVRAVAAFDYDKMSYRCPSLAIKLGHTLRKCAQILKGQAIEISDKQLAEDARQFDELCAIEWCDEVSFRARKQLNDRKRNCQKRLPLSADTKKMVDFLKAEMHMTKEKIKSAENEIGNVWRHLAELALAYLIIFNRRRQGEVSKVTVDEFCRAKSGSSSTEIEGCLSKIEQQLCKLFYRLEISGKRGRTVPLLMDGNMHETIVLLNRKRILAGVVEDNKYVFAFNNYSSLSHIRGSDCLRKFSACCGAIYPETLRATSFRKHVATMSQLLSLKDNELDMLAQFMGHDVRTHREFYRLPEDTLQLAKLSKLFLLMEQGRVENLSGRTLDNVLLEMDADSDVEPEECNGGNSDSSDNTTNASSNIPTASLEEERDEAQPEVEQVVAQHPWTPSSDNHEKSYSDEGMASRKSVHKSKRLQRRWLQKEKEAVERHLLPHILRKKVPQKDVILHCMQEENSLSHRTWQNIRDYCRNRIVWAHHA